MIKMPIHGWGRYPLVDAEIHTPSSRTSAQLLLGASKGAPVIARGMGRSYGDSALAARVINCTNLNYLLDFDPLAGVVHCGSGVTLADLLEVFVPRGWFLPVTPGTKYVTVGGAIASDVHGKNHHLDGCFSAHVASFNLMLASGEILPCSATVHQDLFRATCGGMGLTGVILDVTLKLRPVRSALIDQTTLKADNLEEALALFGAHADATYSVAWIDCMTSGEAMGRSLLMLGEHAEGVDDVEFAAQARRPLSVPMDMPSQLLNRYSIAAFNTLYFHRVLGRESSARIHYEPFFYPLDGILHWNRLYGKNGFTQYQFVIPADAGLAGLTAIMKKITASRRGSFLAVLKAFGQKNQNYLSFPLKGYTLALDFKLEDGLFALLDELDNMVLDYGGRIYLSKDCRMGEVTFKNSYLNWHQFQRVREKYGAIGKFASCQSNRLGL